MIHDRPSTPRSRFWTVRDERCTFIGSTRRTLWLFATIEVCSRLWAGSVLGRRSHRNTKAAINDVILRGRRVGCPLIATDGVEYYVGVMVRLLGSACVYGQVLKTRREQSCRSGRAAREDRHGEPAERRAVGVGGCRDPEHVVPRAPQPHDSSRVGVLAPALAMPRSWRRPAPRARRAPAVLLPFHSAAPGVEVSGARPGRRRCRPVWRASAWRCATSSRRAVSRGRILVAVVHVSVTV